jgi:hypothetical protein
MFFDDPTGTFAHARASAAVRAAFAGRPGERSLMMNSATWIVTARNPAS